MRSKSFAFLFSCGLLALTSPSAEGSLPPASPRSVAEAWVKAMRSGNAKAACKLQIVAEVGGEPCSLLPQTAFACGQLLPSEPLPKVAARNPAEELGRLQVEGDKGNIVIKAAPIHRHFYVVLGLEHTDQWRVAYVRHEDKLVAPAGGIVREPWLSRLWPGCVRLVS